MFSFVKIGLQSAAEYTESKCRNLKNYSEYKENWFIVNIITFNIFLINFYIVYDY